MFSALLLTRKNYDFLFCVYLAKICLKELSRSTEILLNSHKFFKQKKST
jgi:hypothetical protein